MGKTSIEWTDHSVNPLVARNKETGKRGHYCEKVSPGCKFCYSSRLQPRFGLFPFLAENRDKVELFLDESKLDAVLRRRTPTKYFWCDMTDMFYDGYPVEWIDRCFATMALTPQHTHQVLTKRDDRLLGYLTGTALTVGQNGALAAGVFERIASAANVVAPNDPRLDREIRWPLPNVWLGVSVEDRANKKRIDTLRKTPAALRFLSIEPLLEDIGELDLRGIDWIIVGGESGPGARPFNLQWARNIIAQCKAARVACFVKQLGAAPFDSNFLGSGGDSDIELDDKKGGDWEEWTKELADLRVREFPAPVEERFHGHR